MKINGLDRYRTYGLRLEWVKILFENPAKFWNNERMSPRMLLSFRHWGRDVGLLADKRNFVSNLDKLVSLGADNLKLWGMFWTNAAYNSNLIKFFVRNVEFNLTFDNFSLLCLLGNSRKVTTRRNALTALKNAFKSSPIGAELGQGICEFKGNATVSITRTAWQYPDPLVILYSLYQFATHADNIYSFTLTDLIADRDERDALSPRILFGLEKQVLRPLLQGLANDYPDFIRVNFNKNIQENIFLNRDKTSGDVVQLF